MIYSDTKGRGKKDINLCFLQCFFMARSRPKNPLHSTVRSKRFIHYLIIMALAVITVASCFWASADHSEKYENNYFFFLEA